MKFSLLAWIQLQIVSLNLIVSLGRMMLLFKLSCMQDVDPASTDNVVADHKNPTSSYSLLVWDITVAPMTTHPE